MSPTATRSYQATVILNTRGYEDPIDTLESKLKGLLESLGASVAKAENLGYKEFVSGAVKKHAGDIFLRFTFSGPASVPGEFEQKTRLDKTIKRLQVTRL